MKQVCVTLRLRGRSACRYGLLISLGLIVIILGVLWTRHPFGEDDGSVNRTSDQAALEANDPSTKRVSPPPTTDARGGNSDLVQSALKTAVGMLSGSPELTLADPAQLAALLLDPSQELKTRRQAARNLARLGTPQAVEVMAQALTNAPPYLKAAIGESLGEIELPQARELLLDLLQDPNDIAVRGAIRGLALQGNLASVDLLESLMLDSSRSESVRTEAALALGNIQDPNAFRALAVAAAESDNESVRLHAIEGIGQKPLAETGDYLRGLLAAPETSAEIRTEILESLADAADDPQPFLVDYLGHADADVRAAAALAMSQSDFEGRFGSVVLEQLSHETEAEVRMRLYQALANQEGFDLSQGMSLAAQEANPQVRVEGYRTLAWSLRQQASEPLIGQFDQQAVPFLVSAALSDQNLHASLSSVMALSQAQTPGSMVALQHILQQSTNPRITEAAQIGLKTPR